MSYGHDEYLYNVLKNNNDAIAVYVGEALELTPNVYGNILYHQNKNASYAIHVLHLRYKEFLIEIG